MARTSNFVLSAKWKDKPLEGFKQGRDMIWLTLKKITPLIVENGLDDNEILLLKSLQKVINKAQGNKILVLDSNQKSLLFKKKLFMIYNLKKVILLNRNIFFQISYPPKWPKVLRRCFRAMQRVAGFPSHPFLLFRFSKNRGWEEQS